MVMVKTNVADIKARLSEYLDRAMGGERIVICRHNTPVAELRAFGAARVEPRPVGPLPGRPTFDLPSSFFEPLPDEELDLWESTPSTGFARRPRADQGASRVAEGRRPFGASTKPKVSRRRKP